MYKHPTNTTRAKNRKKQLLLKNGCGTTTSSEEYTQLNFPLKIHSRVDKRKNEVNLLMVQNTGEDMGNQYWSWGYLCSAVFTCYPTEKRENYDITEHTVGNHWTS